MLARAGEGGAAAPGRMADPEERLRRVIAATDRIVRERWPLIERIAEALMVRGCLDARELETLFRA